MILPKWNRIGYVEGRIEVDETSTLRVRSILFVRDTFLWFRTRKVVEIGDAKTIELLGLNSPNHRLYKMSVENWLLGGKIDYVSENVSSERAKIIRLVK